MIKFCTCCKEEKDIQLFVKDAWKKSGYKSLCLECSKKKDRVYKAKNRKKVNEYSRQYKKDNLEYTRESQRKEKGPNFIKKSETKKSKSYEEVRKIKREQWKEYARLNPDKINQYYKNARPKRNKQVRARETVDIAFKIKRRLRHRLNIALNRMVGYSDHKMETMELLGCSIEFFRKWIENNFENGMTWDNYGYGKNKWNLEHNIPCAVFNLEDLSQQKECFHWSNIFPMWQKHNLAKKDKLWVIDYQI